MFVPFILLLLCLASGPVGALAQDDGPVLSDEHEPFIASNPDAAVEAFTRLLVDLAPRGLQTRAGLEYAIEEGKARRSARRAGEILALDLDRDGRAANPGPPAGCAYPAPSAEAEIALVGGYHGKAIPSVTVVGQNCAMSAARITVEDGARPLCVVAITHDAMIWQIDGDAGRIEAFVPKRRSRGSRARCRSGCCGSIPRLSWRWTGRRPARYRRISPVSSSPPGGGPGTLPDRGGGHGHLPVVHAVRRVDAAPGSD